MSESVKFDELGFEESVLDVLAQVEHYRAQQVYTSIYTLASRVAEHNPAGFTALGWPLIGTTSDTGNSFTAYLGSALVRRIDGGYLDRVEYVYSEDGVLFRLGG
jgi:hypothetical protein